MGLFLLKLATLAMVVLFGAVAIFIGGVIGYAGLKTGELTIGYPSAGREITQVVTLQAEPLAFWGVFALACVLPVLGGALAVRYGRRGLRKLGAEAS